MLDKVLYNIKSFSFKKLAITDVLTSTTLYAIEESMALSELCFFLILQNYVNDIKNNELL